MDPYTGRVHAMVGGFSFDQSEFNRAIQAMRQPGSSFKPIVYATALDNGYTPSSMILDAPFVLDMGPGQAAWAPSNYDGKSGGLRTLRYGVEHSKNLMTVRLANEVGMPRDLRICPPLRRLRRPAAAALHVARCRRDHGDAHDGGLFDVRQWRTPHQADPDRPDPGPHRPDHLPPRRPQMHRLRRGEVGRRCCAQAHRQPGAGARSADRLPDDLDPRGRRPARHGPVGQGRRQAARRQDRHHERRQGRVVRRLLARSRGRRVPRLRPAEVARATPRPPASTPRRSSATSCRWRSRTSPRRRSACRPASS